VGVTPLLYILGAQSKHSPPRAKAYPLGTSYPTETTQENPMSSATQRITERSTMSHLFGAVSASAQFVEVLAVRGTNTMEKSFDALDEALDASVKGIKSIEFK
jgi:hypothetical protein